MRVVCISMQQLEGSVGSCFPVKISEIASEAIYEPKQSLE